MTGRTDGLRRSAAVALNAVEAVIPARWRPGLARLRPGSGAAYVPVVPPAPMRALPPGRGLARKVVNRVERRLFWSDIRSASAPVVQPGETGPASSDSGSDAGVRLLRVDGVLRLVRVLPEVTGDGAVRANRDLVVGLCEAAGISSFVVPEPNVVRCRVGIAAADWAALVDRLTAEARTRPLYAAVAARTIRGDLLRWPGLLSRPDVARAATTQEVLEVFTMMAPSATGPVYGRPYGCVVERWTEHPDGSLEAPGPNERSTLVAGPHRRPVRITVGAREVTTLAAFTPRALFDVDFPVDAVYTWVDGADPRWQARKARALAETGRAEPEGVPGPETAATRESEEMALPVGADDVRFRDNGELRFSLRSIEQFAPWLRRIYLVTDDQVPLWLNTDHPRLQVVDHREIFGSAGRLPTFNSHAIGARLHHIDGLSEHYLHFNDDSFLGRPVGPELFFASNGVSKFFLSRSTLAFHDRTQAAPHEQARRNVADLLQRDFDRLPGRVFFHVPIPQRRSLLAELEDRYPAEFAATWESQFRSGSDFEVNSWLHHYYGYLTGATAPGGIRYAYFDLADPTATTRMAGLLRRRDADTFCINDSAAASPEHFRQMAEWLAAYFPRPSAFERDR